MNPYEVLGIPPESTSREIKSAYKRLIKNLDIPSLTGQAKTDAEERLVAIEDAMNDLRTRGSVRPDRKKRPEMAVPIDNNHLIDDAPVLVIVPHISEPPNQSAPVTEPVMIPVPSGPFECTNPSGIDLRQGFDPVPTVKSAREWFLEAKLSMENNSFDLGLDQIRQAIGLDSDQAAFHALHAVLLAKVNGTQREQVQALEDAIRLDPKDAESHIMIARIYESNGLPSRANRFWILARSIAPDHPEFIAQPSLGVIVPNKTDEDQPGIVEKIASFFGRIFGRE